MHYSCGDVTAVESAEGIPASLPGLVDEKLLLGS